jgi:hypothetical protein
LAYVVFEGMELQDYGNRIPNLRFEVYTGTFTEEDCTQYDNETLYAWNPASQDPTNLLNVNEWSSDDAVGGLSTKFSSLATVIDSISTEQSFSYADTVYGWQVSDNPSGMEIYPHDAAPSVENVTICIFVNRYEATIMGGPLVGASACDISAAFGSGWWSGNPTVGANHDHGVWVHAPDFTPSIEYDAAYNCAGPTTAYVSWDRSIRVTREPAPPLDTADDTTYTAIPGATGFFVGPDGAVVRGMTWVRDNSTTYKVLRSYAASGSGLTEMVDAYPLGPARPLGHDEYNDQAFWEAAYAAAVTAGDMAGGLTYGVDYPETQSYGFIGTCATGSVDTDCVPIADVVQDLCERAGLTAVDVSDLSECIDGYCVTRVMTARDAIDPLRTVGLFDAVRS